MKNIYLTISLITLTSFYSSAFKCYYFRGLGLKYNYSGILGFNNTPTNYNSILLNYKATFASTNLMKNTHFAVSFYPAIGGLTDNSNDPTKKVSTFCAEVPLMFEWYLGIINRDCKYFGIGITNTYFSKKSPSGKIENGIIGPQISIGKQFEEDDLNYGYRVTAAVGLNSPKKIDALTNTSYREKKMLLSFNVYLILPDKKKK